MRSGVVSRFFGPGAGIPEAPATGSAHCILSPFFLLQSSSSRSRSRKRASHLSDLQG